MGNNEIYAIIKKWEHEGSICSSVWMASKHRRRIANEFAILMEACDAADKDEEKQIFEMYCVEVGTDNPHQELLASISNKDYEE